MTIVKFRPEDPTDHDAIHRLTADAFATMPFSAGQEPDIIRRLRADGDLTVSLVAEDAGAIVGHIAFSPVTIDGQSGWFGLGPISVSPDRQRQGIGSTLIDRGFQDLKARSAKGCVLVGDPAYYARFGFKSDDRLRCGTIETQYIQWCVFTVEAPVGELRFAPGFGLDDAVA